MSRETLMAVSARLFARGGFEAVSMRDIAGEAGMLAGSMYHHFRSKNDLIASVYEAGVAEIAAAVDAAVARPVLPWERLGRRAWPILRRCWPTGRTPVL